LDYLRDDRKTGQIKPLFHLIAKEQGCRLIPPFILKTHGAIDMNDERDIISIAAMSFWNYREPSENLEMLLEP